VALMPVTDSIFMVPESREQPMHVGGLQLFDLPQGCGKDYLSDLYRQSVEVEEVAPLFRRRPYRSPLTLGQWGWREDDQIDLEHHVRHSALPEPGRVRELLALTSRLHGTLLDRKRPLWEAHLIEGLEGDRFAVYTKLHHAVMDGISAQRLLQRSLSTDPEDRDVLVPWQRRDSGRPSRQTSGLSLLALPKTALQLTGDAFGLLPTLTHLANDALRHSAAVLPLQAPRSMLNVSITGSRRIAAESWPVERLRAVSRAADATLNDVVLAMCSGALRAYLLEQDALPSAPLIAMTPVSFRAKDEGPEEAAASSNAVGTILCNLAHRSGAPRRPAAGRTGLHATGQGAAGGAEPDADHGAVRGRHGAAAAELRAGAAQGLAAAVQPGHLQRAGAAGAAVLERRADVGHVPAVDPARRPGHEHHADQLRRSDAVRDRRLPPQRATPAAAARPPGGRAPGPRAGGALTPDDAPSRPPAHRWWRPTTRPPGGCLVRTSPRCSGARGGRRCRTSTAA
jgi:WS/DGAT/MGAT family acyltransferase